MDFNKKIWDIKYEASKRLKWKHWIADFTVAQIKAFLWYKAHIETTAAWDLERGEVVKIPL